MHALGLIRTISTEDVAKVTASTQPEADVWAFGNMLHQEALRAKAAGDFARQRHFEAELARYSAEPQYRVADPERAIEMVTASFEAFTDDMVAAYDEIEDAYALATLPLGGW